jgi:hypothetical protein
MSAVEGEEVEEVGVLGNLGHPPAGGVSVREDQDSRTVIAVELKTCADWAAGEASRLVARAFRRRSTPE